MKINKLILATIGVLFLCGCATVSFSTDLDEKASLVNHAPTIETPVIILLSATHNKNLLKYSTDRFHSEIEAIKNSQVFSSPAFIESDDSTGIIKIAINFKRTWISGGCYYGGCIALPTEDQATNKIEFKVFNSSGTLVFSTEDEISGKEKGTVLDFSKGFKPLRQIFSKGSAVLINRSLAKFQASDAFKKLSVVTKDGIEHTRGAHIPVNK